MHIVRGGRLLDFHPHAIIVGLDQESQRVVGLQATVADGVRRQLGDGEVCIIDALEQDGRRDGRAQRRTGQRRGRLVRGQDHFVSHSLAFPLVLRSESAVICGLPRSHHRKPSEMVRDRHPARAIACCYRTTAGDLEILLVRSRSGRWTLPKGHLEARETALDAAAREAREEAGVEGDLDPVPLLWVLDPAGSTRPDTVSEARPARRSSRFACAGSMPHANRGVPPAGSPRALRCVPSGDRGLPAGARGRSSPCWSGSGPDAQPIHIASSSGIGARRDGWPADASRQPMPRLAAPAAESMNVLAVAITQPSEPTWCRTTANREQAAPTSSSAPTDQRPIAVTMPATRRAMAETCPVDGRRDLGRKSVICCGVDRLGVCLASPGNRPRTS